MLSSVVRVVLLFLIPLAQTVKYEIFTKVVMFCRVHFIRTQT